MNNLLLSLHAKVNWVQNKKIINKLLLSMSSPAYITSIKFTDNYIKELLNILAAYITLPRHQLNVCLCNVRSFKYIFHKIKVCYVNSAIFIGVIPI